MTMASDRNLSVFLRYSLLIALLILIIHALSSDYGVNGEDQDKLDKNLSIPDKPADKGVTGAKGSDSVPGTNGAPKQTGKRKRKTVKPSLSPPGSITVKPGVDEPKQLPSDPKNAPQQIPSPGDNADAGHLMGATGTQKAAKAAVVKTDEDEEKDEDEKDFEKEDKNVKKKDPVNEDEKEIPRKKPSNTGDAAGLSEVAYDGEDDEQDEIQLNPSGNTLGENKNSVQQQLHKKPVTEDVSSAGSFMTYFVIVAIIVIIAYLILHNKKKLMAYIVEGRNTGRSRRQRPTSGNGSEYKPLKNADEAPGGRPEEA